MCLDEEIQNRLYQVTPSIANLSLDPSVSHISILYGYVESREVFFPSQFTFLCIIRVLCALFAGISGIFLAHICAICRFL